MPTDKPRISAYVAQDIKEKAEAQAKARGLSLSDYLVQLIEADLVQQEAQDTQKLLEAQHEEMKQLLAKGVKRMRSITRATMEEMFEEYFPKEGREPEPQPEPEPAPQTPQKRKKRDLHLHALDKKKTPNK